MATEDELSKLSDGQAHSMPGQSARSLASKIKILVVEDDLSTQMIYEKGLFNQIFEKKMVTNGNDALRSRREWHPDIIVLDIHLPGMSGYHVLKEIRETIKDVKTTIVMASSLSRGQDITACTKLGIEGYIAKPFSLRDIGTKILDSYAKREPARAKEADALQREILNKAPIRLLGDDSAQSNTGKIKILIVEDDYTTQMLYEKGLFNEVFDKKIAATGKEGLIMYNEWHPDIIILDIQLPEMNGDQVLKEIRQTIGDQKTTIVMATSQSQSNDVQNYIKLGIEGYVVKPFSLQEIGSKILSYYAKKEPERARKADARHQETLNQSPM